VLFFYGGGFIAGRKSEYRIVGQALTAKASSSVSPINGSIRIPLSHIRSRRGQAFVAFRELLPKYGGNPARAFVAGPFRGRYIAAMLAANPLYLKEAGGDPSSLRGAIRHGGRL